MSWGRYPRVSQRVIDIPDRAADFPVFSGTAALPYGNGRSYGDSCLCPGGTLLRTRRLDHFISFDQHTGLLECEAGVTLHEIIRLALPHGWFLPVTPGTQHVTVGGAIANDVHGKNHHAVGSFGDHVQWLELLRSDGTRRKCSRDVAPDWFSATVGGLGLTGIIIAAQIRLRRVPGPMLEARTQRFYSLAEFYELSQELDGSEYSVAWVDCLARGQRLGRGVLVCADHVPGTSRGHPRRTLQLPAAPPFSLVAHPSLAAFNSLYFAKAPRRPARSLVHYLPYFYPLDRIGNWNLMYGPRGFLQYQCVVPPVDAENTISELLARIAASAQGSFLAVLKQFGDRRGQGLLSFPRPGTTLALDFPNRGEATLHLLDELDAVVLAAGGAVYPAKDARMPATTFAASFPNLAQFRSFVDPRLSSGLWQRVSEST